MVPLVFKTSLGIVRFPEGSTPSLLRQISCINLSRKHFFPKRARLRYKGRHEQ